MGLAAAAGIAAVGALGGGVIAAGGAKSAAKTAAASADQAAQVQKEMYNQNARILNPYVQAGLPATAQINALLGLTPSQPAQSYQTQPQTYNALMPANDAGYQPYPGMLYNGRGGMVEDYSYLTPNAMGDMSSNGGGWGMAGGQFIPQTMQGQTVNTGPTQASAESAFDKFRNYTGYDFRLKQGFNALNSGWAGNGMLKSGAAAKGAINYGQGMASQEFGNYMNMLGNQQAMGLSAASATAGVGQGFANSMGNIAMQSGNTQANAALAGASAVGNSVNQMGMIGSNLLGRSSMGSFNPSLIAGLTPSAAATVAANPGIF